MEKVKHILKDFNLRLTKPRLEILEAFLRKGLALSHADIEREVDQTIDRVTIYRTLTTFEGSGLVHRVLDFEGVTKYALCKECDREEGHHHEHIHFSCVRCEETNCLESVHIPKIKLPEGFEFIEANFLIQGVCKSCSQKENLT